MVSFNESDQSYQLMLGNAIFKRLRLLDALGQPLPIKHRDISVLRDLEEELMERYRVRETAHMHTKQRTRIREVLSIALIVLLLASAPYQQQLADRWHLSQPMTILMISAGLGVAYVVGVMVTGWNKKGPELEADLQADLELRQWILQYCRVE